MEKHVVDMNKVASCDRQGSVYLDKDNAYRVVKSDHRIDVEEVMRVTEYLRPERVIETWAHDDPDLRERLSCTPGDLVLGHKKVGFISYPHEWCATMLKDAALFHLDLSRALFKDSLHLKDAHPWNMLFDAPRFVFVDFTSIVSGNCLFEEEYLSSNSLYRGTAENRRLAHLIREIFERMFFPYFLLPLIGYANGRSEEMRRRIEETTLNTSSSVMTWGDVVLPNRFSRRSAKNFARVLPLVVRARKCTAKLTRNFDIDEFFRGMRELIEELSVTQGSSGYSSYYQEKGEYDTLDYSDSWNKKQKGVYAAINRDGIGTVLDAACNTGWYALMAAKCGKSVVAFDIDEASVELLYSEVKRTDANVLPLVMNITSPSAERRSVFDGNCVLLGAESRLQSDSVLALGIVHHLVLGLGLPIDSVIDRLASFSRKQLVVEFVGMEDEKIRDEPEFFRAYHNNSNVAERYNLDALLESVRRHYSRVECRPSHPETRTLVICEK